MAGTGTKVMGSGDCRTRDRDSEGQVPEVAEWAREAPEEQTDQTRVEDGGLKLFYLTHRKREAREGAVGEEGALAETRVWSHQDSGLQSPPWGCRRKKVQERNCTRFAFPFTGLSKDSRSFRARKHKAAPDFKYRKTGQILRFYF